MKASMLFFGSLCSVIFWMNPTGSQKIAIQDEQPSKLDMAQMSVDDMYSTCAENMQAKIKKMYFAKEMQSNSFRNVWEKAARCASIRFSKRDHEDEALTKDHMQAICVYTAGGREDFYKAFNEAVKTKRREYGSNFLFHSLHFWLTRAIQILRNKQGCHVTYRRTNNRFIGEVNQIIRFGTFASSSKEANLTHFGKKTCFKITTCFGAYLKAYPTLGDHKREVLIPPYETFKIISKDKFEKDLADCETVYVLNSTGFKSNLDCHVAKHKLV
uniref:NAD(P)(+)--arginine ADP-ribosyltransferase n=1 Tax=Fundulus heteroclitus TaxID=8078 RepID=A0A3Q2TFK1_FUNHE